MTFASTIIIGSVLGACLLVTGHPWCSLSVFVVLASLMVLHGQ